MSNQLIALTDTLDELAHEGLCIEQLEDLETIATMLDTLQKDNTSLLHAFKESLEALDIDCTSNTTAVADITTFLTSQQDLFVSNEFLIAILIKRGIKRFLKFLGMPIYRALLSIGTWLEDFTNDTREIVNAGLMENPKHPNKQIRLISYDIFTKLIDAHIKCILIFRQNTEDFTTDKMQAIHDIMKTLGVMWNNKKYITMAKYIESKQTVDVANWSSSACRDAQKQLVKLADLLVNFNKYLRDAERAKKEVQQVKADPDLTEEEKTQFNTSVKDLALDMKKAIAAMRKYLPIAAKHIKLSAYSMERALEQYESEE